MAENNNATCKICGKSYYVCMSCADSMKAHPWKVFTDTSEHYKVFQVVHGLSTGVYAKDEAKEKLKNINLKDIESFRPHIKDIVKDVLKEEKVEPERMIYQHITVYEEVGHGGAASIPEGVTEVISVDMGCVGEGLTCEETQVSICAKDSRGPYNYDVVTGLIKAAKDAELDFAVDVYPYYGSDADVALTAGYDVRHGLIGAKTYTFDNGSFTRNHNGRVGIYTLLLLIPKQQRRFELLSIEIECFDISSKHPHLSGLVVIGIIRFYGCIRL